jgi:hypothetical protein
MHPTSTRLVAAEKARPLDSDGTAPTWRILVGTAGGRLRCSSGAGSGTTPREPWAEAWPGCSRLPLRSQSGLPVLSEACQSPLRVSEASPRGGQTLRRLHQRIGPLPGSFSARLRVPIEASFLPRQRMPRIGCRPSDCCSLASCWLVLSAVGAGRPLFHQRASLVRKEDIRQPLPIGWHHKISGSLLSKYPLAGNKP